MRRTSSGANSDFVLTASDEAAFYIETQQCEA